MFLRPATHARLTRPDEPARVTSAASAFEPPPAAAAGGGAAGRPSLLRDTGLQDTGLRRANATSGMRDGGNAQPS